MVDKLFTEFFVTRHWTRADHCHPLPVLSDTFVICLRRNSGNCNWSGARVWSQAQISSMHVAVGGALLQNFNQITCCPDISGAESFFVFERGTFRIVEDNQIDVAGVVELARAQLS